MAVALHAAQLSLLNSQASLPKLAQFCVIAAVTVTVWDIRKKTRKALSHAEAHTLRDIGMTPGQARHEAEKAFFLR
jgi:uncharacterized protein YjiS (DUF1127 family)